MKNYEKKLLSCLRFVKKQTDFTPEIALILGSGLGNFAENIKVVKTIDYSDIKGFPISTVKGHKGRFVFGFVGDVPVVCMQGRIHYYEGYEMEDVVLPVRLMKLMGAKTLLLTNAAGGINPDFKAGDLMLITDHISNFVPSALRGENLELLGTRFPDMSNVYDLQLQNIIMETAKEQGIDLKKGVYLQASGPNFETPAEIKMFGLLGASAVGMSTSCEAMAAVHAGMRVAGVSLITNMAAGINSEPLSHEEVTETANKASEKFTKLLLHSLIKMK
ncbi:MAG: purine-nucleoside phosphorylase [Clostridia bacterium]|nr:purine-nucleoside phosphorylase [Clostridia bacterium]